MTRRHMPVNVFIPDLLVLWSAAERIASSRRGAVSGLVLEGVIKDTEEAGRGPAEGRSYAARSTHSSCRPREGRCIERECGYPVLGFHSGASVPLVTGIVMRVLSRTMRSRDYSTGLHPAQWQ